MNIINSNIDNELTYNYLLPKECNEEIRCSLDDYCVPTKIIEECLGYRRGGFKLLKGTQISDTKARSIIGWIYAPMTYRLLASQYVPIKITRIEKCGTRHVYDIEVNKNHNYIANKLIVHNCIGKKIPADMAKLKPKFTDGLKLHSWTDKQIEDIWELLLKQSTYCFNRGHAVAYGLLSYLCAYMKVHYPIEFQTAALTVKTGDPTKIGIIINDCENMGIKVLPPNINKSGIDFTSNNGNILFGLSAISGIGRDLAEQLVACRNSKYTSLNNLLETVPLNKGQVISLIKSGAIPCKNKGAMLKKYIDTFYNPLEYKPLTKTPSYNDLVIKYNIDIEKYRIGTKKYDYDKVSLLQVANEIKKRNYETDEQKRYEKYLLDNNKYFDDEYLWEFNALNFFVTNNPFKESSKYIEKTMGQVSVGQDAVVAGTISKIQRKKDKNKKPYAFVWLCSDAGLIEITLWSKQFAKYEEYITKGNSIVVKGIKTDGSSLQVDQIKPYKTWLEHKIATHKS